MARPKSKLFHIYDRRGLAYAWWTDGTGRKVCRRLPGEDGNTLGIDTPKPELEAAAYRQFQEWERLDDADDRGEEKAGVLPLGELTFSFVESQGREWDVKTLRTYRTMVVALEEYFGQSYPCNWITPEAADKYMWRMEEERGLKPVTRANWIAFYRLLFGWASGRSYVELNPFQTVKRPSKKQREARPTAIPPEEVRLLLITCEQVMPWFYPALLIASLTGIHPDELRHLELRDLDTTELTLTVRDEIAKGDRGRRFGLPQWVAARLKECIEGRESNEYLFLNASGRMLSAKTFERCVQGGSPSVWRKLQEEAGFEEFRTFNSLRQSVDTNLALRLGFPFEKAAHYTGHTREVSLRHYVGRPEDVSREMMERLGVLYGAIPRSEDHESKGRELPTTPS